MAHTLSIASQGRPCAALAGRNSGPQCRRRVAALPVHAAVKTQGTATSGLEIGGMRPTSPKAWELISTTLKRAGVSFVSPDQVEALARRGAPILDIRPSNEFSRGRVEGAVNCQFYQPISGWDATKVIRRLGFSFFGVYGTEANPDFVEQAIAAAPKKSGIVVYCNIGGSLDKTGPSEFGRQSRCLTAAYELVQAGFTNIKVLEGGYSAWVKEDRMVEMDA